MGIPLLQGRFFDEHDRLGSEPVVVIDENLAEHAFQSRNAASKRLWTPTLGSQPLMIIGVVGHVRHWGLAGDDHSRIHDQMYYPFAQVPDPLMRFFSMVMSIAVRTAVPPFDTVEPLRRELEGAGTDQVLYEVRTMEQLAQASLARQRFLLLLFGVFAGLSLALASIGIYGVLSYLAGLRVPEFGLRMALGATARDVLRLVFRQSAGMILVGIVFGSVGALAAARLLQRIVVGMRPANPTTLVIMTGVLVLTALVAAFLPAGRASRTDPMRALRQD
jgi:hypothetical protein